MLYWTPPSSGDGAGVPRGGEVRLSVEGFGTERDDVLVSLLLAASRDVDRAHAAPASPARPSTASAGPPDRVERAVTSLPLLNWSEGMMDRATGAGTAQALRRDLLVERSVSSATGRGFVLAAVRAMPGGTGPLPPDPDSVEMMLRALVESSPAALQPGDRVYRTGWRELTLLLCGAEPRAARSAVKTWSLSVRPLLERRGLAPLRLMLRLVDPKAVLAAVPPSSVGHESGLPGGEPALSAAV